jgi:heme/copper-type cytochrome/quinol oxidase subunit 1
MTWNITARFFIAGIAGWMFGGFKGAETGMWGTDIYLHNTLSMVGHIHLIRLMAFLAARSLGESFTLLALFALNGMGFAGLMFTLWIDQYI